MEQKDFPRFHVAREWFAADNMVCVQLVEVAFDLKEQLTGGRYAVRLKMADTSGDTTVGLVTGTKVAEELIGALSRAMEYHEELTAQKA
jgi:hypothetical protein